MAPLMAPPSIKYWDDCVDPSDMNPMWSQPEVRQEWVAAGESPGSKVHISRTVDGQAYLTHVEMRAVAEITIERHFKRSLDPAMVCAIAEVESARQPDAYQYESKLNQERVGLMQVLRVRADWLAKEEGYTAYVAAVGDSSMLYKPFLNVYYGAAYLKWLSTYGKRTRSEEFMVRAYHSGPKRMKKNFSRDYWHKYLDARQNSSVVKSSPEAPPPGCFDTKLSLRRLSHWRPFRPTPGSQKEAPKSLLLKLCRPKSQAIKKTPKWKHWEEGASADDIAELWQKRDVKEQWKKSGEERGKVRFSLDAEERPFLTKAELKAVAGIIVSRHFAERRVDPAMLCAIAEITSKRLLSGADSSVGIMHIPYTTASWLHSDLNYKAYRLKSVEDLSKPFVSMYFGAAYVCWLSDYQNRARSDQFVVQAYRSGPQGVDDVAAGPFWLKYLDALPDYLTKSKKRGANCNIQ